ncbi:head-tail adaptor protein [Paracoccus sp. Z330]|uniref:Head-tail adaptor protein n=1 Tax=Paracoccus onchidii TaxID=3017813 RepID=A0ABT4ZF24_9RHOB|nr:head-tail adaptor protein [Paracoccus onchidii]MDB6177933.1 head-tail adaptor protein [Paracoccus onchidii]
MARISFDRRIQFLRAQMIDDGFQSRPGDYTPFGSRLWAAKSEISDGEKFSAGTIVPNLQSRFTVRWSRLSASIEHTDRIEAEGRVYAIVGIKEVGRRAAREFTTALVAP